MRVNYLKRCGFVALLAGGLCASLSSAAVISPGQADVAAPTGAPPSGTIVASVLLPYQSDPAGLFTGSILSQVIANDVNNPHGGLTFLYQMVNNQTSSSSMNRLAANSFNGFITDMSYVAGPGVVPTFVDRGPDADTVGFSFFAPPIGRGMVHPGQFTTMLIVRTDAPGYASGSVGAINGGVATVSGFVPVPEPSVAGLLIAGAGMLLMRRRQLA
jgi:hypothetical protein